MTPRLYLHLDLSLNGGQLTETLVSARALYKFGITGVFSGSVLFLYLGIEVKYLNSAYRYIDLSHCPMVICEGG
jgi:hypothetical protein